MADFPQISFNGTLVSVSKLLDKTIYASALIKVYNNPAGTIVGNTVPKGGYIGVVDTWIEKGSYRNYNLLVVKTGNGNFGYIRFDDSKYISLEGLMQQGVTTAQQDTDKANEQDQGLFGGFFNSVTSLSGNIVAIAAVFLLFIILSNIGKK